MATHVSALPLWGVLLFIASFLFSLSFITRPINQAALDAGMSRKKANVIAAGVYGSYLVYLLYVSVLALRGVFDVNSLPPRVMIWGGIPLLVILFGFIGNTRLFKTLLRSITLESLIGIHIFRMDIVDLLTIAVVTGANGNLREMAVFPFVWFPAFAPATILFLHTAVFRKMYQLKKDKL